MSYIINLLYNAEYVMHKILTLCILPSLNVNIGVPSWDIIETLGLDEGGLAGWASPNLLGEEGLRVKTHAKESQAAKVGLGRDP